MENIKGIIASDIDGTLAQESKELTPAVIRSLNILYQDGWRFIFITGRTFQWAFHSLNSLSFPYLLSIQNGAVVIEMPSRKVLTRHYLDNSCFDIMEAACAEEPTDFVVYSGFDNNDICYWRPELFSPELRTYVTERAYNLRENWRMIENFLQLPVPSFASLKCFGSQSSMDRISKVLKRGTYLHAPAMKDAYCSGRYIVQVTYVMANKGEALKCFAGMWKEKYPIIAAGDDFNDISMLQQADVKIVMCTAPQEMHVNADVIAPSADENGIIFGLEEALKLINRG